jgi:L-threonylcarbamoyladenylate synthase
VTNVIKSTYTAAELIKNGDVVAFPTETVYGLGAAANNFAACQKIYSLKNRPASNPLIVHVASIDQAKQIGHFSPTALKLAEHFWPGPLTLVVELRASAQIASNVTAGLNTIAIRIPNHKIALEFLQLAELPVAAPSANISNYVSATFASHVLNDFAGSSLNVLLEENMPVQLSCGLESTIIDTTKACPTILRHGIILAEEIESICKTKLAQYTDGKIKAPGMMLKHYSPKTKLRLNASEVLNNEVGIDFGKKLKSHFTLSDTGNLQEAAQNLYAILREADLFAIQNNLNQIALANIPDVGIGIAINDKLTRASK